MTAELVIQVDPKVEELVREIAREPGSLLRRLPQAKVAALLREDRPLFGPMTAGLSAAEREIVTVHKEEVVWVLRSACWHTLAEDAAGRAIFARRLPCSRFVDVPPRHTIRQDARRVRFGVSRCDPGVEELLARIASDFDDWSSVVRLASIAHTLIPSNMTRLHAAHALMIDRRFAAARQLLMHVATSPDDQMQREVAHQSAAACWFYEGRTGAALELMGRVINENACLPGTPLNGFGYALFSDDPRTISEFGRQLASFVSEDAPEFREHIDLIAARRASAWMRTIELPKRVVREGGLGLGTVCERIVDALR